MIYRALCIGINKYPGNPLTNCVYDAEDIATILERTYGWNRQNGATVRLLVDERATAANIRERLAWLVQSDRWLLFQSGHGAQAATRDYTGELDGLDELFCPVDFIWSNEKTWIRDKDYAAFFRESPDGAQGWFISDSCHSGDLSRIVKHDVFKGMIKSIPPPADIAWRNRQAIAAGIQVSGIETGDIDVCAISACRSDQVAMDGSPEDGRGNGAFTWALKKALYLDQIAPLVSVISTANRMLQNRGYEQVSEIIGPDEMTDAQFPACIP